MMSIKGFDHEILLAFADNEAPYLWDVETIAVL